ncbi:hypothetical protein LTR37_007588 [Vermiconidia calcicola]|uniref:Uncharacterized protein n=1 Tax=Vermiconidia calcicola TaxID=1690605 RepID=A0ACC3ND69_9PEZI|nr:hypothetical protein LTR37_007588 [Vermiconidia calcicola]
MFGPAAIAASSVAAAEVAMVVVEAALAAVAVTVLERQRNDTIRAAIITREAEPPSKVQKTGEGEGDGGIVIGRGGGRHGRGGGRAPSIALPDDPLGDLALVVPLARNLDPYARTLRGCVVGLMINWIRRGSPGVVA